MKLQQSQAKLGATLIFVCLLVPCCYFNERYPAQWAPPKQGDNGCWAILGTYRDTGETSGKDPSRVSLGALIFYQAGYDSREATSVKIAKLTEDSFEISVWNGEQRLYSQAFSQGHKDYECSPKGVRIFVGTSGGGTSGAVGSERHYVTLAVNAEGSLIVEASSKGYAVFPLPLVGGGSYWAIFKRLDTPVR